MNLIAARFSGPLYSGETLSLDFWETDYGVAFTACAQYRNNSVLYDGRASLS